MTLEDKIAESIARRATEWWLLHRDRNGSERDRDAFLSWLRESPAHVHAYLSIAASDSWLNKGARAWPETIEQLVTRATASTEADAVRIYPDQATNAGRRVDRSPTPFGLAGVIGAVVAAILLGGWLLLAGERMRLPRIYETAHAQQGSWPLPDGSILHLDSDSRAVLHFSGRERVVVLEHGRAMFQVAHDPGRRFRVDAGDAQIVAVGTEFDVDRNSTDIHIVVLEGQVAVVRDVLEAQNLQTLPLSRATPVKAGQQVEVDSSHVSAPSPADVRHSGAWLQREIVFDNLPLAQVVADFNRYSQKPIEIADEHLKHVRISGVFGADDVGSFLTFLRGLDGVQVVEDTSHIRVYERPRAPHDPVEARAGKA